MSQKESLCILQGCIHYPTTSFAILQCPKKWRPGGELDGAGFFPYFLIIGEGCIQQPTRDFAGLRRNASGRWFSEIYEKSNTVCNSHQAPLIRNCKQPVLWTKLCLMSRKCKTITEGWNWSQLKAPDIHPPNVRVKQQSGMQYLVVQWDTQHKQRVMARNRWCLTAWIVSRYYIVKELLIESEQQNKKGFPVSMNFVWLLSFLWSCSHKQAKCC